MIEYHYVEQGSEEWLKIREGKYTGSNADKLLTTFGANEYAKAKLSTFSGNFWTKRGHLLEEEAVDLYEKIYKVKVDRPGFVTNSKYPECLYSPDGLPPIPLLEVKSFDIPQHLVLIKAKSEDDIPLKIRAQIHYGLLICERPYGHLIAYNPSDQLEVKDKFKVITIKRNPAIAANFKRILIPKVAA